MKSSQISQANNSRKLSLKIFNSINHLSNFKPMTVLLELLNKSVSEGISQNLQVLYKNPSLFLNQKASKTETQESSHSCLSTTESRKTRRRLRTQIDTMIFIYEAKLSFIIIEYFTINHQLLKHPQYCTSTHMQYIEMLMYSKL